MKKSTQTQTRKKGFTLIELSIVLVIIGLIVGGVLVGQDLIKAAELRAAIGQLEKFDAATNTFRTKYNGIPGDIPSPANFGFATTGITSANNGNGILDNNGKITAEYNEEQAAFFAHMSTANLIQETITGSDFTKASVGTISSYAPGSKLGKGAYVIAVSTGGVNYYILDNLTVAAGVPTFGKTAITPIDAFGIDSKLDDGSPLTGKVIPVTAMGTRDAGGAAASGTCVDTGLAPDGYNNASTTFAKVGSCAIQVRASW